MKSSMNLSDDEFFVKYKKILPLAKLQVGNIWIGCIRAILSLKIYPEIYVFFIFIFIVHLLKSYNNMQILK